MITYTELLENYILVLAMDTLTRSLKCVLQDLQLEIESHQHVLDSLDATGARAQRGAEPARAHSIQQRIDGMSQRWVQLKSKSVEIRCALTLSLIITCKSALWFRENIKV